MHQSSLLKMQAFRDVYLAGITRVTKPGGLVGAMGPARGR